MENKEHIICGVKGTLQVATPTVGLHKTQKWTSEYRKIKHHGTNPRMRVFIRYDDECGNGYQSFAITAEIVTNESLRQNDVDSCGCLHDEIEKFFPELAHLVKHHSKGEDRIAGYPGNALYLAGDKDCWGRRKGDPSLTSDVIYFGDSTVPHEISTSLKKVIEGNEGATFGYKPILGSVRTYKEDRYPTNYALTVNGKPTTEHWGPAQFNSEDQAKDWTEALNNLPCRFGIYVIERSSGKERELDAAREAAHWPEATDEDLMAENLKEVLEARLPGLLEEFKAEMDSIGLKHSVKA